MQPIAFVVFVVCLVAVSSIHAKASAEHGDHMDWVNKCKEQTKLNVKPDYTKSADEMSEETKCFIKCIIGKYGLTPEKADKIETTWMEKFSEHHAKDKFSGLKGKIDECKKLVKDGSCDSITRGVLCLRAAAM